MGDIRVAVSQRLCPPWRVPFFRELAARPGIDLTLFYGRGTPHGAAQNHPRPSGFHAVLLPTVSLRYREVGVEKYRAFHPTLLLSLWSGRYDVVIVEPFTNFGDDVLAKAYTSLRSSALVWTDVGEPPEPSRLRRCLGAVITSFVRASDACIALNNVAASDFRRWGVPEEQIFLAPNAIDTGSIGIEAASLTARRQQIRNELGLAPDDFVALFVGALEQRKRVGVLIDAVGDLQRSGAPTVALIVGDGSHLPELRRQAQERAPGRARFAGSHYEDVAMFFVAADIVVLPGQGGLTINQALACGIPCIVTREAVGGGETVSDYVQDGVNGLVVGAGDVVALAEALRSLAADAARLRHLHAGAEASADSHSLAGMVDGFERAIRFAASTHPSHRRGHTPPCQARRRGREGEHDVP